MSDTIDDTVDMLAQPLPGDVRMVRVITLTVPTAMADQSVGSTALKMLGERPAQLGSDYSPSTLAAGTYEVTVALLIRQTKDMSDLLQ